MTRVKICGITNVDDALAAVDAGAAAIGLNFYPRSPRCIGVDVAERIVAALPEQVCVVGVFVDAARADVGRVADTLGLDALQFHGGESPAFCAGWRAKVIKALRLRARGSLAELDSYRVDFELIDAYVEGVPGGTGRPAAWEWLHGRSTDRLILAGGLTPGNVADAVRAVRPFAVDVASGVERAPGRKDVGMMRRFVANAQSA